MTDLRDNAAQQRYEWDEEGQVAFCNYRQDGDTIYLTHVESPPALRGKGTASRLMQAIADKATVDGHKLVGICSYAAHWLRNK